MQNSSVVHFPNSPIHQAILPELLSHKRGQTIATDAAMIGAGVVLLALTSQVAIPLPFTPVPLTLQTFAVMVMGASLGSWRAALSAALYLALGVFGLPVFAAGASLAMTGGYLLGFVFAAGGMGLMAEWGLDRSFLRAWPLYFVGHLIIFAFGVGWLAYALGSVKAAVFAGFLPFIPGEIVKTTLAAAFVPGTRKLLKLS